MQRRSDTSKAQARSLVMTVAMASSLGSSAVFADSSEYHVWPFTNHVWPFSTQSTEYNRNPDQPLLDATFRMPALTEPSLAFRPRLTWRPNRETDLTVSLGRKASIQFRLTYSLLPWKAPRYSANNFFRPMPDSGSMLVAYPDYQAEGWGSTKGREPRYALSPENAHFRSYSGLLRDPPDFQPYSNRFTLAEQRPAPGNFGAVLPGQPRISYTDRSNETFNSQLESIISTRYDNSCSLYNPASQLACKSRSPNDPSFNLNELKVLKSKSPDGLHANIRKGKGLPDRLAANFPR